MVANNGSGFIVLVVVVIVVIVISWNPFFPSWDLDEVFTYNHICMALMSLRSRSHVKESMVLTRADHLFIHNYIRSLLNNILRPILMGARIQVILLIQSHTHIYIYIYILRLVLLCRHLLVVLSLKYIILIIYNILNLTNIN